MVLIEIAVNRAVSKISNFNSLFTIPDLTHVFYDSSIDMLQQSMFNDSDNQQYQIEPGTQEDIEVLQLLKIPGFGSGMKGEDEINDSNFNDEIGALADKNAMDNLVKELMS